MKQRTADQSKHLITNQEVSIKQKLRGKNKSSP